MFIYTIFLYLLGLSYVLDYISEISPLRLFGLLGCLSLMRIQIDIIERLTGFELKDVIYSCV